MKCSVVYNYVGKAFFKKIEKKKENHSMGTWVVLDSFIWLNSSNKWVFFWFVGALSSSGLTHNK